MKKIVSILFGACLSVRAMAQGTLAFDVNAGVKSKMTVYDGTEVNYTAYERLFYVTNVEDSTYQFLNVYVPDGATQQTPIFLRTYVGGYMASPAAQPQASDATGRALKEGYVVVIPGTRGRNSTIVADKQYAKTHKGVKNGQTVYTGRRVCRIHPRSGVTRYVLYLHGGYYTGNMQAVQYELVKPFVEELGYGVIIPDYPLCAAYTFRDA